MKKIFIIGYVAISTLAFSCNNKKESNSHKHEDGSTHEDHDTTKPDQQEFNVNDTLKKDTTTHTHKDGKKHSH